MVTRRSFSNNAQPSLDIAGFTISAIVFELFTVPTALASVRGWRSIVGEDGPQLRANLADIAIGAH
jgi:hypothetical protein